MPVNLPQICNFLVVSFGSPSKHRDCLHHTLSPPSFSLLFLSPLSLSLSFQFNQYCTGRHIDQSNDLSYVENKCPLFADILVLLKCPIKYGICIDCNVNLTGVLLESVSLHVCVSFASFCFKLVYT